MQVSTSEAPVTRVLDLLCLPSSSTTFHQHFSSYFQSQCFPWVVYFYFSTCIPLNSHLNILLGTMWLIWYFSVDIFIFLITILKFHFLLLKFKKKFCSMIPFYIHDCLFKDTLFSLNLFSLYLFSVRWILGAEWKESARCFNVFALYRKLQRKIPCVSITHVCR